MKKLLTLFSFVLTFSTVDAQLRLAIGTNPEIKDALEKVISDYPSGFAKLRGPVISEDPQTVEYASRLKLPGAEGNSILRHSGQSPIYSWQASMPGTEDFDEATKKYKTLYNQLKLTSLKLSDGYTFMLSGEYEAPAEQKRFCSSVFSLSPSPANFPKLRIELSLQFEFPEWKMFLAVYEKEREDDEPGKTREF